MQYQKFIKMLVIEHICVFEQAYAAKFLNKFANFPNLQSGLLTMLIHRFIKELNSLLINASKIIFTANVCKT